MSNEGGSFIAWCRSASPARIDHSDSSERQRDCDKRTERRAEEWLRKRSVPLLAGPTLVASSHQRFYDALTTRERSRGQFSKTREVEALQERLGCREAQAAVCTGKFLYKLELSELHDKPALVGIEETSISAWLIGCLKAMQASTSSAEVVRPEIPFASFCSLK